MLCKQVILIDKKWARHICLHKGGDTSIAEAVLDTSTGENTSMAEHSNPVEDSFIDSEVSTGNKEIVDDVKSIPDDEDYKEAKQNEESE